MYPYVYPYPNTPLSFQVQAVFGLLLRLRRAKWCLETLHLGGAKVSSHNRNDASHTETEMSRSGTDASQIHRGIAGTGSHSGIAGTGPHGGIAGTGPHGGIATRAASAGGGYALRLWWTLRSELLHAIGHIYGYCSLAVISAEWYVHQ